VSTEVRYILHQHAAMQLHFRLHKHMHSMRCEPCTVLWDECISAQDLASGSGIWMWHLDLVEHIVYADDVTLRLQGLVWLSGLGFLCLLQLG